MPAAPTSLAPALESDELDFTIGAGDIARLSGASGAGVAASSAMLSTGAAAGLVEDVEGGAGKSRAPTGFRPPLSSGGSTACAFCAIKDGRSLSKTAA
jgi:hypothetical protein